MIPQQTLMNAEKRGRPQSCDHLQIIALLLKLISKPNLNWKLIIVAKAEVFD